jgi:hypothetical protein
MVISNRKHNPQFPIIYSEDRNIFNKLHHRPQEAVVTRPWHQSPPPKTTANLPAIDPVSLALAAIPEAPPSPKYTVDISIEQMYSLSMHGGFQT